MTDCRGFFCVLKPKYQSWFQVNKDGGKTGDICVDASRKQCDENATSDTSFGLKKTSKQFNI